MYWWLASAKYYPFVGVTLNRKRGQTPDDKLGPGSPPPNFRALYNPRTKQTHNGTQKTLTLNDDRLLSGVVVSDPFRVHPDGGATVGWTLKDLRRSKTVFPHKGSLMQECGPSRAREVSKSNRKREDAATSHFTSIAAALTGTKAELYVGFPSL